MFDKISVIEFTKQSLYYSILQEQQRAFINPCGYK